MWPYSIFVISKCSPTRYYNNIWVSQFIIGWWRFSASDRQHRIIIRWCFLAFGLIERYFFCSFQNNFMNGETTSKLFSIRSWISSFKTGVTSTPIKFICSLIFDIFFSSSLHFLCCSFIAKLMQMGFVLLNRASFDLTFQTFYMSHVYCMHLEVF